MGVKWILLWNPSSGAEGVTAAGAAGTTGTAANQPAPPPPPPPPYPAFSGRAAFDAVAAAVARVCGPPLPGPNWKAEVSLLRSSATTTSSSIAAAETAAKSPDGKVTGGEKKAETPADLTAVSFGDDPLSLHFVCDRGRNVLTADSVAAGPLIVACGGYQPRARLHLSGPRFAAGGLKFGDAGAVVARVSPRPGDPPRAVAVLISLESASDVAEAAPALRELAEALRSSVRKVVAEAAEKEAKVTTATTKGGQQQRSRALVVVQGTLEPLAAPLAEFALPRFPQGPQHAAVQVAALAAAVLSRPRGQ